MDPKLMTPEEIAEIRALPLLTFTEEALLSHIAALQAENERMRVIAHHAAEAARERRYQRLIENHDAYTNMARSRDAEAKEIGMAMALAIRYEEPEA